MVQPEIPSQSMVVLFTDLVDSISWKSLSIKAKPSRTSTRRRTSCRCRGRRSIWLARQKQTKTERVFKFCFDPDRLGVIHKDLKTSNILIALDRQGIPHPRVIDWPAEANGDGSF